EHALEETGGVPERSLVFERNDRPPTTLLLLERRDVRLGRHALTDRRPSGIIAVVLEDADVLRAVSRQLEDGMFRLGRRAAREPVRRHRTPASVVDRCHPEPS